MSDKKLLTESEMRRFMRLANLEPLAGRVIKENYGEAPAEAPELPVEETSAMSTGGVHGGGEDAMEADPQMEYELEEEMMGGMGDLGLTPEQQKGVMEAFASALGIEVDVSDDDEGGKGDEMDVDVEEPGMPEDEEDEEEEDEEEEESGEEMEEASSKTAKRVQDLETRLKQLEADKGKPGVASELKSVKDLLAKAREVAAREGGGEKQTDESIDLSEDDLVETVLNRVTARLVAEARANNTKKKGAKARMADKAKKLKKKNALKKEAVDSKGGGPLVHKGGYKGGSGAGWENAEDMKYGKGEKGGKGGHSLEKVSAKAEHTVSHGKHNLATKGSVK